MSRIIVVIVLWFFPTLAAAQQGGTGRDWLSSMQRVMPIGAVCADLDWELVSYYRFHSKGATLEIWTGVDGPGATLSFDSAGKRGVRANVGYSGALFARGRCYRKVDSVHRKLRRLSSSGFR
jgi:hypothetical protein